MGFYLKKFVSLLLNPLSLILVLLLLSLWFLYKKRQRAATISLSIATLLLILFASRPFSYALIHPLESRYAKLTNPPGNIDDILFLGGDLERRGWEVLRLHRLLPDARIITTGYAGNFYESAAHRNKRIFTESGIDPGQIVALPQAKDTVEEAKAVKTIVGSKPFILVTSAYHMPRAMMIFRHEGLHPIPAPTDFIRKTKDFWNFFPNETSLMLSQKALHEYLGILWLKLKEKAAVAALPGHKKN